VGSRIPVKRVVEVRMRIDMEDRYAGSGSCHGTKHRIGDRVITSDQQRRVALSKCFRDGRFDELVV
jgi:hypothetical protein